MKKITRILGVGSYLITGSVLALAALVSLYLVPPAIARAATLPTYNYTKTFDTTSGFAQSFGVTTDAAGNIYTAGEWNGTVIFDGPGGSDSQTSANYSVFVTKYSNSGNYDWTKTFAVSSGTAEAGGITTDSSGDIFVDGNFSGTVIFDGSGGSDSVTSTDTSAFITKYNADGSYGWTKTFDTTNGAADGYGIATDASGNIFATGNFTGTVIFDGPGGSDSHTDEGGVSNAYITKYNADGSYGWTKTFDTTNGSAYGFSVATDSAGDVYTTGQFNGTVVFDGVGGSDSQTAEGSNISAYITKYNADGSYGWTKTFDSTHGNAYGYGLTVDAQGNIYETGNFTGTIVFDGVGGSDSQTDLGTYSQGDAYLTKYNADGSYGWTKTFDTTNGYANSVSVTTDSLGDVYFTGEFSGTVVFDGVGGSDSQTDVSGDGDTFLTQITATGNYGWTKIFGTVHSGGVGDPGGQAVATDTLGNVYISGDWNGTVTFDGTGGSDTLTSNSISAFLTSYDAFVPAPIVTTSAPTTSATTSPSTPNTGFALVKANFGWSLLGIVATTTGIFILSRFVKKSTH
jgi:hypothetical protein